jgi:diguanylate cyclase (GGDEF)-like protein
MKPGKAQGRSRTNRRSGIYAVGGAAADALTLRAEAPAAPATLLGIPEAEFTPRVREAVIGLKSEVDRLTHENEQIRARLDDAARSADQDMLLPILNRRAFVREITRFIAFAERYGTPSSLLYFDLDNFKAVNDIYGHAAGDVVLRHFSDLIASQIRETDILARLGGDEFGVILAHVKCDQAVKKGASLAKTLREHPPVWQDQVVKLNFSHGAYELRAGENADAAMAQADHAMYEEKRAGRENIIGS